MATPIDITCRTEDDIEKDRLHCGTCKRDYAIIAHKHICSLYIQCTLKDTCKYSERYYSKTRPMVQVIQCKECATRVNVQDQQRRGYCPSCEYFGRYVYTDDDPRCPSCKLKESNGAQTPSIAVETGKLDKPVELQMYTTMHFEHANLNSANPPRSVYICGVTSDSVMKGDFEVSTWSSELNDPVIAMRSLHDYVSSLSTHTLQWKFANDSHEKLWLLHLYDRYGPENKTPLNFYY